MYRLAILVFGCTLMMAQSATTKELDGRDWSVTNKFRGGEARQELSGAICPGNSDEKKWCLVVNDEKRWAQFFAIESNTLKPKDSILLLPKRENGTKYKEIDAEAAAYDDGFVYVAGSHGMSRKKCKLRESQFFVFRLPVDKTSGKPGFQISEDDVAPEIERSSKLRQIIKEAQIVGAFSEKCLDENGVNFEGLAVVNGEMYFGSRGPSVDGHAFVLQVATDRIFGNSTRVETVHKLNLGSKTGIRDLARVDNGVLVLTGHVGEEDLAPEILFWDLETKQLNGLGELPVIPGKKAETVLVLDEKSADDSVKYRILVLYDGLQNGNPTEYNLERKR